MGHLRVLGLIPVFVAVAGCCWLCWHLLRQNGRILLRLDDLEERLQQLELPGAQATSGLPFGTPAPDFRLFGLNTKRTTLADYRGQSFLLIFFNPECSFCRDLLPGLSELGIRSRTSEGDLTLVTPANSDEDPLPVLISSGGIEPNRQFFARHQVAYPVLVQQDTEVSAAYRSNATPSGYLIDGDGNVASALALGADKLLALVSGTAEGRTPTGEVARTGETGRAVTSRKGTECAKRFGKDSLAQSKIKRDGLKAGTPAPDVQLLRLDGRGELSMSALRGQLVLLVFSSPHCEPCNELAPKLERFHRDHPQLEVVMISNGEPGENRDKMKEHGVTFVVALQQGWVISRRYAIFATPAAYLINRDGIITYDVAVGTEAILTLLRSITPAEGDMDAAAAL